MKPKFQIGDVVKLKSGGEEMTIIDIEMVVSTDDYPDFFDGKVKVRWFEDKKMLTATIHQDALDLIKAKSEQ
jgi:uncharacterized protein YodC (DUF2158 family)